MNTTNNQALSPGAQHVSQVGARSRARAVLAALCACAFAFACALAAQPARAFAAEATGDLLTIADKAVQEDLLAKVDQGASCSYSATVNDLSGNPMQGVNVRIWRVADLAAGFPLAGAFAELPITYDTAAPGFSWQDTAEALRGLVDAQDIAPVSAQTSGREGSVRFEGLSTGVYLVVTDAAQVASDDGQTYTFRPVITTLPSVISVDGESEYSYDVASDMDKYSPQSEEDVVYTVRKVWDGDAGSEAARPSAVTVELFRSGGGEYELYDTVELSDANEWFYEWTSDIRYSWTVAEVGLDTRYTYTVHADRNFEATPAEGVFTVTNTLSEGDGVPFEIRKAWDDAGHEASRPDALPVQIFRDGQLFGEVNLSAAGEWSYRWTDEPGHSWSVVEALADSPYEHKVVVEGDGETGQVFNISNAYSDEPVPDEVSYAVSKKWSDEGQESARPESVSIVLLCDGKAQRTVKLDASNGWAYAWTSDKGHVWAVSEESVPDSYVATYASSGSEAKGIAFEVTNTYHVPDSPTSPSPQAPGSPGTSTRPSPLPKTGDVWWPVAPLACVGMACLMVAIIVGWKRRREE